MNRLHAIVGLGAALVLSGSAYAQSVISAHSGLIHYVEGTVLLDSKPVEVKIATFPDMKENSELRSEDGRAEVLLNPGAFLRMGENSAIRMVSNKLTDSRVEFLSGAVVIESDAEGAAGGQEFATVLHNGAAVHLRKSGIYRFDSSPSQVRVYSGEAEVEAGGNRLIVKSAHMVALNSALAVEKFDTKDVDALSRWSRRRAEYISMANVSSAKFVNDQGTTWKQGGWYYNPYFGIITFIPGFGIYRNPYGYLFYSPGRVNRVYEAPVVSAMPNFGNAGRMGMPGYSPAAQTSSGYSGVIASAPAAASRPAASMPSPAPAPAASAPVSRDSGRVGGGR